MVFREQAAQIYLQTIARLTVEHGMNAVDIEKTLRSSQACLERSQVLMRQTAKLVDTHYLGLKTAETP